MLEGLRRLSGVGGPVAFVGCDSLGQSFAVSHPVLNVQPGYLVLQCRVNAGLISFESYFQL